ncbi:hypothetical protein [Prevotella melaninogenica]|uniref:Uncharacterized protein n=1 Tax=Prevotella melaninogenica TaxID=28132 RepID=A0A250KG48_9BACT|nr:hypothetical protein [Prevotella melaninogenica]BBA28640.1 hypothetical protein PMEL1_00544 [Prevotella melaninogenica]
MSYQINEFIILNQLQDLTSANEIITMLHLISQGKREIQTQKSHIATLCGQRGKDKNNNTKLVNKIIKGLTEKGYLTSTNTDYILIKGINKTTTKWVLSDKSMSIIKSLNSKQKQAKATSKIKPPTQAYQATTKEAKEATKETDTKTEQQPSLAEQRRQLEEAIKD